MQSAPQKKIGLFDIAFFPIGCLLRSSPLMVGAILLVVVTVGIIASNTGQSVWWGAPDFFHYEISNHFETITDPSGIEWHFQYEKKDLSAFSGLVRHTSRIRFYQIPLLTHDILVTSGDFADQNIVHTQVFDHHFYWQSATREYPQGAINLLHTVPENEEILSLLSAIRPQDTVTIRGREIFVIEVFNKAGEKTRWWQDQGCNTLLVTGVEIKTP